MHHDTKVSEVTNFNAAHDVYLLNTVVYYYDKNPCYKFWDAVSKSNPKRLLAIDYVWNM